MKISIVTPVWNDPRVERALASIASQEVRHPVETIVVDGGSAAPTQEVLAACRKGITRLISEPDRGLYDAMNKGVAAATGDVVGILNADDAYADRHVLAAVADAFAVPETDLVYGDLQIVGEAGKVLRTWRSGPYEPSRLRYGWVPPHPTVFVRRRLYERIGSFDLDYSLAADYDFLVRALRDPAVRAAYVPRVLVRMSHGGASTRSLRGIVRGNLEAIRAYRANGLGSGLLVALKPARKVLQYFRA